MQGETPLVDPIGRVILLSPSARASCAWVGQFCNFQGHRNEFRECAAPIHSFSPAAAGTS
jgi:hypothetical protein